MPQSLMKPKLGKNVFVLSASQLSTAELCIRKWWFERVKKLPRLQKDYFTFGEVLHKCIERFLRSTITGSVPLPNDSDSHIKGRYREGIFQGQLTGEPTEIFPTGWDKKFTPKESRLVRTLITKAIEEGIIIRNLQQRIEHEFWEPLVPEPQPGTSSEEHDTWITGFIDYTIPGEVHDHKSTKNFRYALSPVSLADNIQMLLYGTIINFDECKPSIVLRHNYFLKDPNNPAIRKVEATVSRKELDAFWLKIIDTAKELKYIRDNVTEWVEIVDPPKGSNACSKYGGCAFQNICAGIVTVEKYTENINQIIENTPEKVVFKGWDFASLPSDGDKMGILQDKLNQTKGNSAVSAVEESLPEQAATETTGSDSAPPWADKRCTACEGIGWNKKGNPCGICTQLSGTDMGEYEVLHNEDNTILWENTSSGESGIALGPLNHVGEPVVEEKIAEPKHVRSLSSKLSTAIETPVATAASEFAPVSTPEVVSAESISVTPEKGKGRGRPKKAFTLAINCYPVRGTAKVKHLDVIFKELAQQVATAKGKTSYFELDAFERRDILAIKAEEIAEHLGTDVCLARPDSPDMRSFIDSLRPYASIVWEPMAATTTVIEG